MDVFHVKIIHNVQLVHQVYIWIKIQNNVQNVMINSALIVIQIFVYYAKLDII